MSKLFYDHLINMKEIQSKLDSYDLSKKEKKELLKMIDETIHHEVMDVILTHLPRKHHEEFLEAFTREPHHQKHILYLQEKTEVDIEGEMQAQITSIVESLLVEK